MRKATLCMGIAVVLTGLCRGFSTYSQEGLFLRRNLRAHDALSSDEKFLEMVQKFPKMHRVTDKPYRMHLVESFRCNFSDSGAELQPDPFKSSVHGDRYCDVYVSEDAKEPIQKGDKTYPIGSLIIKVKYPNDKRQEIELLTVMRKREAGYFPEHGDWEYSVVDGKVTRVLSRGRSESCVDCHDEYQHSDFVSREYLRTNEERERHWRGLR